jgi:hypothetical protein
VDKPEHLGPMARSLIETFAGLTLPQQRRVFSAITEIMEQQEALARLGQEMGVSETRPGESSGGRPPIT